MPDVVVGVGVNPLAPRVGEALAAAADRAGLPCRVVDLPTVTCVVGPHGAVDVRDRAGPVDVTHLAPALLYWQESAALAQRALERRARALNPVDAVLRADDKAATALRLAARGVRQLETWVVPQDRDALVALVASLPHPVVVKRTHGAQGRWVRLARDAAGAGAVLDEFAREGRGALVVQRYVEEAAGRSLRVLTSGGAVVAATERQAPPGELQSNVSRGASQAALDLGDAEADLALRATAALGLGHAGVDLLRTRDGPVVLEVNACPDFTSMLPHTDVDVAAAVVRATVAAQDPVGRDPAPGPVSRPGSGRPGGP